MSYWDVLNRELGRLDDAKSRSEIRLLLEGLDQYGVLEALAASGEPHLEALVGNCLSLNGHLGNVQVSVGLQLGENVSVDPYRRLLRSMAGETGLSGVLNHRQLGILSHGVGVSLLSHEPQRPARKRQCRPAETLPLGDMIDRPLMTKQLVLRQSVARNISRAIDAFPCQRRRLIGIPRLADRVLRQLIGDIPVNRLLGGQTRPDLRELTWKSWLQLANFTANRPRPLLLAELAIFKRDYWLSGGRIDVLELVDRNGDPLSGRLLTQARSAISRNPKSLPELIGGFPAIGETVFLKVIDFKFQVGDAISPTETLKPSLVDVSPLSKHRLQVARYLPMGNIAYRQARDLRRTPWDLPVILFGELWYVFADRQPIVHTVELTASEREGLVRSIRDQKPALVAQAELHRLGLKAVRGALRHFPTSQASLFDEP